jgi:hypothetical protein
MKRALIAAVLVSAIALNGCLGSFALTNKILSWNKTATSDNYVNSAIMWVLGIIPVYELSLFVDVAIFNVAEFYGGKNPMAFTNPQKTEKTVMSNGKTYKVTMGANALTVDRLDGQVAVRELSLRYDPSTGSYFTDDCSGRSTMVASIDGSTLKLFSPDGGVTVRSLEEQSAPLAFAGYQY